MLFLIFKAQEVQSVTVLRIWPFGSGHKLFV